MKNKIKTLCLAFFMLVAFTLTGCNSTKVDPGYLTLEEVNEIVENFDTSVSYTKYSVNGTFNLYENVDENGVQVLDREVKKQNQTFTPSNEIYQKSIASYYLAVPLHITPESWNYGEEDIETFMNSTRYALESRIYIRGDADTATHVCYYYRGNDGGLIVKTFSQNKALRIIPGGITSHGKWNITIEYDKHGYLVSEKFATINAFKDPDSKTCYGEATYAFQ